MQEWITNTILPILTVIVPVWIHLSMKHKSAMEKKVDVEVYKARIEPIEKDVEEIKQNSVNLKAEIMDELKYIRGRVDQMADKKE